MPPPPNRVKIGLRTRKIIRKFRTTHFPLAEQKVLSEFKKQRAKGLKVNGKWFQVKMRQMIRSFMVILQ